MISDIGAPVLKGGVWRLHHRMVCESGKVLEIETHTDRQTWVIFETRTPPFIVFQGSLDRTLLD